MALQFEWHSKKALANKRKHGITFEEASTIFGDPVSLTIYDPVHSIDEVRFITIGTSARNRIIVAVHTYRGSIVRIISARKATGNEIKQYHES